ncbi:MAG: hypothetical protein CM15mP66_02140 [Pseudomonadota bacterium]|nr:MAG: hypothetical protein CM15mP66_02140 [Pseudomonadota bacterium]
MVEATLNPVLNVMQTMPHYAYLVPITVLLALGIMQGQLRPLFCDSSDGSFNAFRA